MNPRTSVIPAIKTGKTAVLPHMVHIISNEQLIKILNFAKSRYPRKARYYVKIKSTRHVLPDVDTKARFARIEAHVLEYIPGSKILFFSVSGKYLYSS